MVESKDELRKRLGRSTDAADALALALYAARDDMGVLRIEPAPEWLQDLFTRHASPSPGNDTYTLRQKHMNPQERAAWKKEWGLDEEG